MIFCLVKPELIYSYCFLTEAGKIALNLIKTQGLNDSQVVQQVVEAPEVETEIDSVVGETGSQVNIYANCELLSTFKYCH